MPSNAYGWWKKIKTYSPNSRLNKSDEWVAVGRYSYYLDKSRPIGDATDRLIRERDGGDISSFHNR